MSATARKTAPVPDDIRAMKGGAPIVSVTGYTFAETARAKRTGMGMAQSTAT